MAYISDDVRGFRFGLAVISCGRPQLANAVNAGVFREARPVSVKVPCPECGQQLVRRGWPRCGMCRQKRKIINRTAFRRWRVAGCPGTWEDFRDEIATQAKEPAESST
jgi:hypothetical protein